MHLSGYPHAIESLYTFFGVDSSIVHTATFGRGALISLASIAIALVGLSLMVGRA